MATKESITVDDGSSVTDSFYTYADNDASGEIPAWCFATRIYGRDNEIQLLLNTYERVVRDYECGIVLVHGQSGSGKTLLVETLREPVTAPFSNDSANSTTGPEGYFCASKYFQKSNNSNVCEADGGTVVQQEPYSAIMAIFSDLCDLISQSKNARQRKIEIQQQLSRSDGAILAKTVSSLSSLLYSEQQKCLENVESEVLFDTRHETAFAKFKLACRSFLRIASSEQHPIVFFLDDIQWMDRGSRQLLETFLLDSELKHVLFVLAYRDEDPGVTMVEDMLITCTKGASMQSVQNRFLDLAVKDLDSQGVHTIVASTLAESSGSKQDFGGLSDLIALKTKGNPYHVVLLLESISREGLLIYTEDTNTWTFDVDEIQHDFMVADSLADLLTRKIRRLPDAVQTTLKVASLLGYRFSEEMLLEVALLVLNHMRALLLPKSMCDAIYQQSHRFQGRFQSH